MLEFKMLFFFGLIFINCMVFAEDRPTLEIGQKAPDFSLPGVDGKTYSLNDFQQADFLVIIFTCNHCPTAQAYENKIIQLAQDYQGKGVAFVAISPNSPAGLCLEELGYSDLGDTFEDMKIRARDKNFNFPYLYDGDTQTTANRYGPVATPHVFIFDQQRTLRYVGRVDDTENPYIPPVQTDARNALEALLAGKTPAVEKTKVFGCSIKWAEKSQWRQKLDQEWASQPVSLDMIDDTGVKNLLLNDGDQLRILNLWATWCGPCVIEFPEFIAMHRMYKGRNVEFVSLSVDKTAQQQKVLQFLTKNQAAVKNYIYQSGDVYKLIELVDKDWNGSLPFTLIIAPKGQFLYKHAGLIEPIEVRKEIVTYLGRFWADDKK
jgi:peroxiredoxin